MKTTVFSALFLILTIISHAGHADTFGVYFGGGLWDTRYSGEVGVDTQPATLEELGVENEQSTYFFIAIEHFVPILPNIKIQKTDLSTEGRAIVSRDIVFDEITIPANADTVSELDLSHIDYTLYWELLDNYVSWDLGLTGRSFDGFASIEYTLEQDGDAEDLTGSETTELKETLPLLYTKVQIDLPFSGWYIGGLANYVAYDGDSISDIEAKLGYMTDGLGLDVGFELGYRTLNVVVEDSDDLEGDLEIDGAFASVILHI